MCLKSHSLAVMASFLLQNIVLFSLLLKCLTTYETSPENCHKVQLFGPGGAIFSPGYPSAYHNHSSCTWYLSASPGNIVTIKFKDLDIEQDEGPCVSPPCCTYSWVKVEAFRVAERKFCGTTLPEPLYLDSRKVYIKFHTSIRARGGRGFRLTYSVGKCMEGKLKCTVDLCYEPVQRCDGTFDCPDFSDELDCGGCPANMTSCGADSECYDPFTQRCNGVTDCVNGNDEKSCSSSCLDSIRCVSGVGCYSQGERCDGVTNCGDGSDEKNCKPELCRSDRGGFLCANAHCIRESWKCDRMNDCGDKSDETNCLKNSVITAAVMGSLICGLLLVVAVSCSCKLYFLRYTEHQLSCRETPLSSMEQEFVYREPPPPYSFAVGDLPRSWMSAGALPTMERQPEVHRPRRQPRRRPPRAASSVQSGISPSSEVASSSSEAATADGSERKLSSDSNKSDGDKTMDRPIRSDYLCDNLVVVGSDSNSDDTLLIPLEDASAS